MFNKPVNVEVKLSDCDGSFEKMIKRFVKDVKEKKIVDEVLSRKFYKKPSKVRNERNLYLKKRKKMAKKMNNL